MNIQLPRGTYDLFNESMDKHTFVKDIVFEIFNIYGFNEIKTPIFESSDLFTRSVGETSDIVNKEMYTFEDKKGRSLSLRPEFTAPVVRSYLERKCYGSNPKQKYCYYGPAFRYERSQKGRFRQFYQLGIEALGTSNLYQDVELISMANTIISNFGLSDKVELKINSIGNIESRLSYKETLKSYFSDYKSDLCQDCISRLDTNPLRILDCKVDSNKDIIKQAPSILDSLLSKSKDRFDKVCTELSNLNIKYRIDNTLVRGLDYYNDTVFEFVYKTNDTDYTIIAGGRYDGLVSQLSNQDQPGFGFALGIERLISTIEEVNESVFEDIYFNIDIIISARDKDSLKTALDYSNKLREIGLRVEVDFDQTNLKQVYKFAEQNNLIYIMLLENDEIKLKELGQEDYQQINIDDFIQNLRSEHD
ncbi:MAG: histidine--tRNA ligase [Mycoplasmatales bacterium]